MKKLKTFFHNLAYLSKFDIKKRLINNPIFNQDASVLIQNILYYNTPENTPRPLIYSPLETVTVISRQPVSLARFGDGELELINGNSIPFQEYDPNLAHALRRILAGRQENLLVGIPHSYFFPHIPQNNVVCSFQLTKVPLYRRQLLELTSPQIQYCDTGFTGLLKQSDAYMDELFNILRSIWDKKQVITVGCAQILEHSLHNIFDNALSQEKILVPSKHAYRCYKEIRDVLLKKDKSIPIILLCGPLAKVLASDLCAAGFRALDLGHIAKSYDYYKRRVPQTDQNILTFYQPE